MADKSAWRVGHPSGGGDAFRDQRHRGRRRYRVSGSIPIPIATPMRSHRHLNRDLKPATWNLELDPPP